MLGAIINGTMNRSGEVDFFKTLKSSVANHLGKMLFKNHPLLKFSVLLHIIRPFTGTLAPKTNIFFPKLDL